MSSRYLSNHIVIDTGPLIAFAHLGWFDQLGQLFENIYLTEQVHTECQFEPEREDAKDIAEAVARGNLIRSKIKKQNLENYPGQLGVGETSSIELALQLGCPVILDDKHARSFARKLNVSVIGTAGVLIYAKQAGLITSVTDLLNILREKQYYFSDELLERIKQHCRE
jgi:hypothetical protein